MLPTNTNAGLAGHNVFWADHGEPRISQRIQLLEPALDLGLEAIDRPLASAPGDRGNPPSASLTRWSGGSAGPAPNRRHVSGPAR